MGRCHHLSPPVASRNRGFEATSARQTRPVVPQAAGPFHRCRWGWGRPAVRWLQPARWCGAPCRPATRPQVVRTAFTVEKIESRKRRGLQIPLRDGPPLDTKATHCRPPSRIGDIGGDTQHRHVSANWLQMPHMGSQQSSPSLCSPQQQHDAEPGRWRGGHADGSALAAATYGLQVPSATKPGIAKSEAGGPLCGCPRAGGPKASRPLLRGPGGEEGQGGGLGRRIHILHWH